MIITINPEYKHLKEWIEAVPQRFTAESTVLYKGRNIVGTMLTEDRQTLCVKKYLVPLWPQRIVYSFLRKTKAERAYYNALTLLNLNIPTPKPVAYIVCKQHGLITDTYLITEYCPYKRNFYEFRQHGIIGYEHIIKQLAALAAHMHNNGLIHKDFSPGNLLFEEENGHVALSVIDINRMSTRKQVSLKQGCKNFERLWGNCDFFLYLAKEYALRRNISIAKCQQYTLKYHNQYWKHRK